MRRAGCESTRASAASRAPRVSQASSARGIATMCVAQSEPGRQNTGAPRATTSGPRRAHIPADGKRTVRDGRAPPSSATHTTNTVIPGTPRSLTPALRYASSAGTTRRSARRSPTSGPGRGERPDRATYAPRAGTVRPRARCDAATEASRRRGERSVPSRRRSPTRPRPTQASNHQAARLRGETWRQLSSPAQRIADRRRVDRRPVRSRPTIRHFPFTGEPVGVAAAAGREDARAAVDAASGGVRRVVPQRPCERRAILSKAADLLMERQAEIAGIVTEETGGIFGWGMFNVELAAGHAARGGGTGIRPRRRGDPVRRSGQARDGRPRARLASSSGSPRGTRR